MTSAKKRERGQGSIGNVPGSRFLYIWYYDNAGKQHRESTKSTLRSVAQEQLNQRLAAMGRGERSPQEIKSIRYEDMRAILIANYRENKIGEIVELPDGSLKIKGAGIKYLDEFFKGMRLQQIDTDVLRSYREQRTGGGVGDTTVNRNLALLRRMMTLTIREKKLQFLMPHFPMTSEKGNVRKGFVEPAKFRELLDAMPETLRPYLLFFYESGCRPKAARQIVWEWVDLKEEFIHLPTLITKNDEALPLPISVELKGMLKKLFRKAGPIFDATNFRKAFQSACVKVGLGWKTGPKAWEYEGLIPYDLRRSAVRNLKRAGVDDSVAMKISGHKTRHVFDRYNITSVDDVADAMKRVTRHNASSIQVGRKVKQSK
jgi:integrase